MLPLLIHKTHKLPVGGLAIYQKKSYNEPNIDFYFMNPPPQASCNGSLALLPCFLYQLPDYTVVAHPKEGVERMLGEEKEKSPSSHSHTDGCHMGFWRKEPLGPSIQTTVNSLMSPA